MASSTCHTSRTTAAPLGIAPFDFYMLDNLGLKSADVTVHEIRSLPCLDRVLRRAFDFAAATDFVSTLIVTTIKVLVFSS